MCWMRESGGIGPPPTRSLSTGTQPLRERGLGYGGAPSRFSCQRSRPECFRRRPNPSESIRKARIASEAPPCLPESPGTCPDGSDRVRTPSLPSERLRHLPEPRGSLRKGLDACAAMRNRTLATGTIYVNIIISSDIMVRSPDERGGMGEARSGSSSSLTDDVHVRRGAEGEAPRVGVLCFSGPSYGRGKAPRRDSRRTA